MALPETESGWYIDDIQLPIPPASVEKRIVRSPDSSQIDFGFPVLFNPGPQKFELIMKGWIWPATRASALDQKARAAETEIVQIHIPISEELAIIINGKYAIDKSFIKVDGPNKTDFLGTTVSAWQYEITFVEFAAEGENQDVIEAGKDLDEFGIGLGDITIVMPEVDFSDFDMFGDLGIPDFLGL